ncbi:MAG: large subunit ribosomal protein [Actinomycetota bacterium]|nr:large subunit ribosomal protein [Actinomycetota bacterium]
MATKADAGSDQIRRKTAVIDEIRAKLDAADAAVLTEYRGLTVTELAALRAALRPASTEYKVFKNTLARRAAEHTGLAELVPLLEGPVAIAFVSGDAVMAAKALRDFARSNPNLIVKGGLLDDRVMSQADMAALADVPPREVLLARLAGGFQAPLVKAAGLLQAFTRNMAYGLKALVDQRIAGGEELPSAEPEAAPTEATPTEAAPTEAATETEVPADAETTADGAGVEDPEGGSETPAVETEAESDTPTPAEA